MFLQVDYVVFVYAIQMKYTINYLVKTNSCLGCSFWITVLEKLTTVIVRISSEPNIMSNVVITSHQYNLSGWETFWIRLQQRTSYSRLMWRVMSARQVRKNDKNIFNSVLQALHEEIILNEIGKFIPYIFMEWGQLPNNQDNCKNFTKWVENFLNCSHFTVQPNDYNPRWKPLFILLLLFFGPTSVCKYYSLGLFPPLLIASCDHRVRRAPVSPRCSAGEMVTSPSV